MFFEDFSPGQVFTSPLIPVYGCEIDMFYLITDHGNLHMDKNIALNFNLKDRVVPGLQLLGLTNKHAKRLGLLTNAGLFLGLNNVRFQNPAFPNDELYMKIEVLHKKEVEKWIDRGIVTFKYTLLNKDDDILLTAEPSFQILKKRKYGSSQTI
jgi:acyl dehydratase